MSAGEHAFNVVGGVPTNYARHPVAVYGTIGVPRTFHCTHAFFSKLDACFQELWRVSPHSRAQAVVSAGAHVQKPGAHGQGRAFDIDAIFWPGKTLVTRNFPTDQNYYLGVEAVLRKHFGVVLDYNYNAAHRDHFHVDDTVHVGFSRGAATHFSCRRCAITSSASASGATWTAASARGRRAPSTRCAPSWVSPRR